MYTNDIKSKESESKVGNSVLAIIFSVVLVFMIFHLFKSFDNEPISKWHFYFSIIGYAWGLIFVSIFLFITIKNLYK